MADESPVAPQGAGFRFRDTTRAPFTTTVRLRFDRLGSTVAAQSADISMEGMFVKTEEPRPVGTLVQFEFDVEDQDQSGAQDVVQGLGDVVWVRTSGGPNKPAGMGIQFRYVDAHSREHVYRIVTNFIQEISGDGAEQSIPESSASTVAPVVEASPIGNATVAAPAAALPGWTDATDAETSNAGLAPLIPEAPGAGAEPAAAGGDGSSALMEPALTSAVEQADSEDVTSRDSGSVDGPFGALLNAESADGAIPKPPGRPPLDLGSGGAGAHADATALNSASGSFSLSVPKLGDGPSEPSVAAASDPPPAEPLLVEPMPAEPLAAEGGVDRSRSLFESGTQQQGPSQAGLPMAPTAPDGPIGSSDSDKASDVVVDQEGLLPSLSGMAGPTGELTSLRPIEPYEPVIEGQESAGGYYGGGGAASGRRRSWLVLLLLVALAAAAYFTKPWQYLGAFGSSGGTSELADEANNPADAVAVATDPGEASADPGGAEEPTLTNELSAASAPDTGGETDSTVAERIDPPAAEPIKEEAEPIKGEPARPSFTRMSGAAIESPVAGRQAPTRLVTLDAADFADRTQVRLAADAPIGAGAYSTVVLSGPPRFLVKIKGLTSSAPLRTNSSRFVSVRTGLHQVQGQSELHVVFDMTSEEFTADVRLDQGELLLSFR